MRRISSYIPLIAALAATCFAGQIVAADMAVAASSPPVDKAALNKAVQEALSKAQAEKGAGGAQGAAAGASGAGSTAGGSGAGLGSSEALSNLTSGGREEEETIPTTPATSTSSSGVSMSVLVPIFIVGAILLLGIAFLIVRDARSVAPVGGGLGSAGSAQDRAARQRKRRAKAKAARRQRKRNR